MQLGFENVDEAADGEAALAKLSETYFSLVISDWNMEPMSGKVLLEHVRANKQLLEFALHHDDGRPFDRQARTGQARGRYLLYQKAI